MQASANDSVATASIGRRLAQSDEEENRILADPPVEWANPGPVPGNPTNTTIKANRAVFSVSDPIPAPRAGFPLSDQHIITASISATGTPR